MSDSMRELSIALAVLLIITALLTLFNLFLHSSPPEPEPSSSSIGKVSVYVLPKPQPSTPAFGRVSVEVKGGS